MSGTTPPNLTVYSPGIGTFSASWGNGVVQSGALLSNLRAFVGLSGMTVFMIGTTSANDGGQGLFVWNSTSTATDDGGVTTIAPSGLATGRWIRESGSNISVASVTNIASLRALGTGASPVYVQGYYTTDDGGEGMFTKGASGTDNGGTIIVSAAGTYYRQGMDDGPQNVKWFGVKGNGTSDDTTATQAALTATGANGTVFWPAGTYLYSSTLTGNNNQQIIGSGSNSTIFKRTGNYGDTLAIGTGTGAKAAGAVRVSGIWFELTPAYVSGNTTLTNLATSGAHVHLIDAQFGIIEDCVFWRMPYGVRLDNCTITTVRKCWFEGVWDPLYTAVQEGIAGLWLDNTTGNCEIIAVSNCYFTGNLSSARSTTWTASDGTVTKTVTNNVGSQYGILSWGCEDFVVSDSYIGGNSSIGIYCNPASGSVNLDWRVLGNFFDGAGEAGGASIYFATQANGSYVTNVAITGNAFNGELESQWGIVAYNPSGTSPAVTNFSITGNAWTAQAGSCLYLISAVGGVVSGNSFTGYNSLNVSAGADFTYSAALYASGNSTNISVSGNTWGGTVNSDVAGGYTYNGCVFGGSAVGNSVQFGNYANGIGTSVNEVGLVTDYPTILAAPGNYQATQSDQVVVGNADNTTAWAVLLPINPPVGRVITVKDGYGNAATHNIVVGGNGGPNVDGSTTYTISTNYGFVTLVYSGVLWNRIASG